MWSGAGYDYERLPRERLPPRRPDDDFGLKKPPLLDRPGDGTCSRYEYNYAYIGNRDCEDDRSLAHERSGPPHKTDDPGYKLPREDHLASRQPDYRDIRDSLCMYPNYVRERSPHKKDSPYFKNSPVNQRDSPHSRSGSSVSSSFSPDRSKAYVFNQSQHSRSVSSLDKRNISQSGKERPSSHSLKTSRDVSPSGATAAPPSKTLDKSSILPEKELAEAVSRWASEKDKADGSSIPGISDFDAGSSGQLYDEHHEGTGATVTENNELFEDSQHVSRSKAIAAKTKEIEEVLSGSLLGAFDQPKNPCGTMSWHQVSQNPIPEFNLSLGERTQTASRRKRRRRPSGERHPITWGDIKTLVSDAQRQLMKSNIPESTENILLAMMAQITKNSSGIKKETQTEAIE